MAADDAKLRDAKLRDAKLQRAKLQQARRQQTKREQTRRQKARGPRSNRPSRGTLVATVSAIAVLGVVVTVAVTADGYEAVEVPRVDSSVWVMRDSGQYARVNTDIGEIDTVRAVEEPSALVQSGGASVIYSQGYRQRWSVDPAGPVDLVPADESDLASSPEVPESSAKTTPAGTREIVSSGEHILYRTDTGQVYLGAVGPESDARLIDPFADSPNTEGPDRASAGADADAADAPNDDDKRQYVADAVAVSPDGLVALYSAGEGAVRRFDVETGRSVGSPEKVSTPPQADAALELAVIGERWVLTDAAEGHAWISGRDGTVDVDIDGEARLGAGSADGDTALIADSSGLIELNLSNGTAERIVQASGTPTRPVVVGDDTHVAWLSTETGTLWSRSTGATTPLAVPEGALEATSGVTPVIRTNGDRAILNETTSGLLWTVPDGDLIPLEEWSVDEDDEEQRGAIIVEDVAEQEPPVAAADAFGVRTGELVTLPVLLNDHDPNKKDVLTIDAASVTGLSEPGFGELSVVGQGQSFAIRVSAPRGQATFTYAVTDGVASSPPTTVTLTVAAPEVNTAAVWCGVDACQQDWPTPQLLPGGTVIVPVLNAWVDPEGDPFVLSEARKLDPESPVRVVTTSDGRVAIRHSDANGSASVVQVEVTITDAAGATSEKTLEVVVTGSPALEAAPVAVTAGAGETVTVRVDEHTTGGSGSFRLVDAVATSASAPGLVVSPNAAGGEIELSAPAPGQYIVTYSVIDSVSQAEQSAIIRLTVSGDGVPLTMAPTTVFVRAGEDTTVDVFDAVQNTSGRVLILSGAVASDPLLNVGVVDSSQLRLSGTTADGNPGLIGRAGVTVADGAGAAVTGSVAVFLAPAATDVSPIALPDAVTVRAGQLARIAVTANDVSPRGAPLVVSPLVEGSGAAGELAFASGGSVRYLAPTEPGTYRLGYSVALETDPARTDNSSIAVTVLPSGANRPPKPRTLHARVLTGQAVSIPVDSSGVDPDGDSVILMATEQPADRSGTTSIAAEGNAIVYTAPSTAVDGGQVSFAYTVRDSGGAEAAGVVRVGVLDSELADTAPVTYSDHARAQAGASIPVRVEPVANDRDPAQGTLELVALTPNAPAGTSEFERLAGLVDPGTSLDDGRVMLRPGDVSGTNSYVYTVRSTASSSTAQGLIVVSVAEQSGYNQPQVTDTVLTARTRGDLERDGIDVVSGKVGWTSGNVDELKLSLWGDASKRYSVEGRRIVGDLPAGGDLVPFEVRATDAAGGEIASYGFLRIPAFDDMRVQLVSSALPIEVDEEKSVSIDVRSLVDLPASDDIELHSGAFTTQRAAANCTPSGTSGGTVEAVYAAGSDAPWSDSCLVPVRLDGQTTWSHIVVPIAIRPQSPQAILTALSRTIAPGATESIQLFDAMTSWEGERVGDRALLDYQVSYDGSSFTLVQNGDQVSFEARADARPGTRESATVSVSAFGGLSASITLVVGAAPPDAPRGATFTQPCTVTAGTCSVDVVGVPGEYDPFAGKAGAGLKLVGVGSGSGVNCDVATVSASGSTSVSVVFPGGQTSFGGECVVPYTVTDAQGRTGPGTVTIDVLGYPQTASSITTTGYSSSSVTLEVALGEAARAHPALTGVAVYSGGQQQAASCSSSVAAVYSCVVSGLVNGEKHEYTARAVNSVGESADTSPVTTWAFQAPEIGAVTAEPVYQEGRTSKNNGVIELSLVSSDDTQAFRYVERNETITRQGATTTQRFDVAPGQQVITIVPLSRFEPPITGSTDGEAKTVTVTAAGAPIFSSGVSAAPSTNTSITVGGGEVNPNGSVRALEKTYVAWRGGNEPRCSVSGDGGSLSVSGGEVQGPGPTLSGLADYELYHVKACTTNGFGVDSTGIVDVFTFVSADAPEGDTTYTVATTPSQNGNLYTYDLQSPPAIDVPNRFTAQYWLYGEWRDTFTLSADAAPGDVRARTCRNGFLGYCSGETAITPATAVTTVAVEFAAACSATATEDLVTISQAARGSRSIVITPAADKTSAEFRITWTGAFAALDPLVHTVELCPPPPDPEPEDPEPEDPEPVDPDPGPDPPITPLHTERTYP